MNDAPGEGTQPLVGWLPHRLDLRATPPRVDWVRCPPGELDDSAPKFGPTTAALLAAGHAERSTGLAALRATRAAADPLEPAGFLFHIARCGSTLLSNVLSALPASICIKEAQPIDACLRTDHELDRAERARLLVDVLGCLGQRFGGAEQRYYVKLTSWNLLHHALLRACFPSTPCVFLYRDPLEALVSMLRAEPAWEFEVVPGLTRPGYSVAEYYARVLAAFLRAGLEMAATGALVVSYSELSGALVPLALTAFGVPLTDPVLSAIEGQRSVYSKDSRRAFVPDADEKRREASPEAREAIARWATPAYLALERVREQQRQAGAFESAPAASPTSGERP